MQHYLMKLTDMEGGKYKQELPFSNSLCAVSGSAGLPQLFHKAFLDILLNMDFKGTGIIQVTITCHYLQYFSFFPKLNSKGTSVCHM